MSIAKCRSAQLNGLSLELVTVEVDISNGLNSVSIVGLGDRSVEEAKDRVSAAIKNSGFISPKQKNQKVVISLAPAHIRKEGSIFDLAIAVAYLRATGEVMEMSEELLFVGELSLHGEVRPVSGVLPILCQAKHHHIAKAFVPVLNSEEASLAYDIEVMAISNLRELIDVLNGDEPFRALPKRKLAKPFGPDTQNDMRFVRGNESAKRGLEIAAAGGHNVLMYGPPGTGKTMLAQSFQSILPELTLEETIEVTGIHSAAGVLRSGLIIRPPFRAPHHTASYAAIVGGSAIPRPGEITLAHRGVLFMDEFPEFGHEVIEALRQPLEERSITVSRARGSLTFPAQCILLASMNPCPCGKPENAGCECTPATRRAYRRRISGPILDRFDLWLNISKVDYEKMAQKGSAAESSVTMLERVRRARQIQIDRFAGAKVKKRFNSEMSAEELDSIIKIGQETRDFLRSYAMKLNISGRAFHRIIKVAQTIADLAGKGSVEHEHILEALRYRSQLQI